MLILDKSWLLERIQLIVPLCLRFLSFSFYKESLSPPGKDQSKKDKAARNQECMTQMRQEILKTRKNPN